MRIILIFRLDFCAHPNSRSLGTCIPFDKVNHSLVVGTLATYLGLAGVE